MIKLATALGPTWLRSADIVDSIGASKPGNKEYPEPTRMLILSSGQKVYISDTPENLAALIPGYVPEPLPAPKVPTPKKAKKPETDTESPAPRGKKGPTTNG